MTTIDDVRTEHARYHSLDPDVRALATLPNIEVPVVCSECGAQLLEVADWEAIGAIVEYELTIPDQLSVARCPMCLPDAQVDVVWSKSGAIPMISKLETAADQK